MKKMLLVLSFIALATLAANAKDSFYNFTFDGYCDGMSLRLYTPNPGVTPKTIVGGTHNFFDCANTEAVGGFKHALSPAYQLSTGAVLDVSDEQLGIFGIWASSQYNISTNNHTWVLWYGPDGVGNYVLNYGTYSNAAPAKKGAGTKASGQR
jgi:hypothetical protein